MDSNAPAPYRGYATYPAAIAEEWYRAIAHTSFVPFPADTVHERLLVLTYRAFSLLHADRFDPYLAQDIGVALVHLRFLTPTALQQTLVVLGTRLIVDRSPARVALLAPRVTEILGSVAAGFLARATDTVLVEQEAIRSALFAEREAIAVALRESEIRYRTIFTGAAIGITLADLEGHPIECSPAIERMLGFTSLELRRMIFTDVTHPDDIPEDRVLFAELVEGKRNFYQKQKRYLHKNGTVVWGNLTASLVRDDHGAPQFTIGMIEDITTHKRMVTELSDTQRRLAESQEAERMRLARDLHDGAVQLLLDINHHLTHTRRLAGGASDVMVSIETVALIQQKIRDITAQLRDIVRGLRPPGLEEFGLETALDGYLAQVRRERPLGGPSIRLAVSGDAGVLPLSVSLPLFRAAQEALRNALEHASAQLINLELRIHDGQAVLSVRDDGKGFHVPDPLRAFAHQGHFGLIGIAERVEIVGGSITIQSELGGGTAITVRVVVP